MNTRSRWVHGVSIVCFGAAGLAVTAPLWRDHHFLDPVLDMQGWQFLTPAAAGSTLLQWFGVPLGLGIATLAARAGFGAAVLHSCFRYARKPERDSLAHLVLAIMSAVLFAGVGHVWPWFLIWVVAPAALVGRGVLWRLALCAGLAGPFLNVFWLSTPGWQALPVAGVAFFGAVCLLAVCPVGWSRLEWGT